MSADISRLSWAARPALLEAAREPDLLMALLLADLMSPSLWDFREKIRLKTAAAGAAAPHGRSADNGPELVMEEIHDYMDRHLFHASPREVEEIWGCLDLKEERARLGSHEVDYVVAVIRRGLEERREMGILSGKQDILPLIDAGAFPDYEYSTIDVIRAHRRRLHRGKHKPLGITSCADEAVLSAALAWAAGHVPLEGVVVFGSPLHYTTLVERHGRGYWFNGKHEYHDADSWARECASTDAAAVQKAFAARQQGLDRLVTPLGGHRFHTNESTLSPARLARTDEWLTRFFGAELRQIAEARERGIRFVPDPLDEACLRTLDEAPDAAAARRRLKELAGEYPGSVMELAHYAFRDLWVEHPEAYVEAAARGHLTRKRAAGIISLPGALDVVREVAGRDSIFDDLERIALPDEVLLFGTGTHRDRALLLYTLLRHAPYLDRALKDALQLVFTAADSFVLVGEAAIGVTELRRREGTAELPGRVLLRLPPPSAVALS
ncbi:MAG: hypothetical protein NTW58_03475 [Actinobacteria bacterium]|nr:hypothetical protein [Actinomycetota bacterium]